MNGRIAQVSLILAALALFGSRPGQAAQCEQVEVSDQRLTLVYHCKAASTLLLVPYIWSPVSVEVQCPGGQVVYTGETFEELSHRVSDKDAAWCGLWHLWKGGPCQFALSPFQDAYIGVKSASYSGTCNVVAAARPSPWMLGSAAAGLAIFVLAEPLSTSMTFRVTSGGVLFSVGSVIILMFMLMRMIPGKRSLAATLATLGTSALATVKWLTGRWLPAPSQVLHTPWAAAYLLLSSLLGAAVTYVYGGTDNHKINTVVRVGLQLLGLLLLYGGTWTHGQAAAIGAGTLILGTLVVPRVARRVKAAKQRACSRRPGAAVQHMLDDDLRLTPLAAHTAAGTLAADRYHAPNGQVPSVHGRALTPIHLKVAPPSPWALGRAAGADADDNGSSPIPRSVVTFEEKMARLQGAVRRSNTARGEAVDGDYGAYLSLSAAIAEGGVSTPNRGPTSSAGTKISPLVKSGMILNPETKRAIKISGPVYAVLEGKGYTADLAAGVMRPPPIAASSGKAATPAKGSRGLFI